MFLDYGVVGKVSDKPVGTNIQDELGLRVSTGLSVNWKSPFGPVRLDFAKVLSDEDYDETESFRFSAGTNF